MERPSLSFVARKQKRVTKACDFCHRRGLRCKRPDSNSVQGCLTCEEYDVPCTQTRVSRKRGTKPGHTSRTRSDETGVETSGPFSAQMKESTAQGSHLNDTSDSMNDRSVITAWIDIYLDTIHPMYVPHMLEDYEVNGHRFPLFCEQELLQRWANGSFPSDRTSSGSLMALCALSAEHVKSGALFNTTGFENRHTSYADEYLVEAIRSIPTSLAECQGIEMLRSLALLALVGTQIGDTNLTHKFLSLYHGMVARDGLHDEARWPTSFTPCDREVLRRIFWAIYRLEVRNASVMGHLIRIPESQCLVEYPSGFHHEQLLIPNRNGLYEDWFPGWNSVTDLYRVLEHAILSFRANRMARTPRLEHMGPWKPSVILQQLAEIQQRISPQFNTAAMRSTTDSGRNRSGFQAANIVCTTHVRTTEMAVTSSC
jgi:hypothetical protein